LIARAVIREISDYRTRTRTAARQELERHLEHCVDCKIVVDQTRLTVDVFCDSKPVELPADVKSGCMMPCIAGYRKKAIRLLS